MPRSVLCLRAVVRVGALLALAGSLSAAGPAALQFQSRPGRGGITVYDDVNFAGEGMVFRRDVPDLREFNLNDRISSLRVARGEFWEVCEDAEYRGRCVVLSGWERDLRDRGWNDRISSLRQVDGPARQGDRDGALMPRDEIVLFEGTGYRGAAQNVTGPVAALGVTGRRAGSVQILSGVWQICDGPQWSGHCARVDGSVPDLERLGLQGVLSARPLRR